MVTSPVTPRASRYQSRARALLQHRQAGSSLRLCDRASCAWRGKLLPSRPPELRRDTVVGDRPSDHFCCLSLKSVAQFWTTMILPCRLVLETGLTKTKRCPSALTANALKSNLSASTFSSENSSLGLPSVSWPFVSTGTTISRDWGTELSR